MDREFQQLQFDISERVRLHPQQPGIKKLVELDLYPDVEIEDQETHLRIHGYLRLAGKYVGDEEDRIDEREEMIGVEGWQEGRDLDEIAYVIPVEITLPSDRVDMDHIAAEVESFDYRVLSPFELQIEAVLTIDGLLPDPKKEEKTDSKSDVSFAGSSACSGKETGFDPEEESPDEVHLIHVENGEARANDKVGEADIHVLSEESTSIQGESRREDEKEDEKGAPPRPAESSPSVESSAEERSLDSSAFGDKVLGEVADVITPEEAGGEKSPEDDRKNPDENNAESRVKFGILPKNGKRDEEFQLSKEFLRKPSPAKPGPEKEAADSSTKGAEEAAGSGEEWAGSSDETVPAEERENERAIDKDEGLHWSQQFLGAKEDTFVKMRMVIVQKGESLETLAERYGVSISSILRLNGLDSGQLEEGQIIYIPGEERKTDQ